MLANLYSVNFASEMKWAISLHVKMKMNFKMKFSIFRGGSHTLTVATSCSTPFTGAAFPHWVDQPGPGCRLMTQSQPNIRVRLALPWAETRTWGECGAALCQITLCILIRWLNTDQWTKKNMQPCAFWYGKLRIAFRIDENILAFCVFATPFQLI